MSAIALNSGNVRFRAMRHALHMTTIGAKQTLVKAVTSDRFPSKLPVSTSSEDDPKQFLPH